MTQDKFRPRTSMTIDQIGLGGGARDPSLERTDDSIMRQ